MNLNEALEYIKEIQNLITSRNYAGWFSVQLGYGNPGFVVYYCKEPLPYGLPDNYKGYPIKYTELLQPTVGDG